MQNLKVEPLRLITISISHYCEKVRWALDRLEVPYVEEPHAPLFHRLATRIQGGQNTVPVLVTPTGTLSDSTAILHYLDGLVQNKPLYPPEPELRQQVEQLAELFDTQVGPATRQWGYSCLPDDRMLLLNLWRQGAPPLEQALLPLIFPLLRRLLRQRYKITATSGVAAYKEIQHLFQTVSELLADGRSYLVGNRFSAADLTFAALAAPALRPENYGVKVLQFHELPPDMLTQVKQLRQTPAGAYVMRLYREERHRSS